MKPAIVINAYNRPRSLARLLQSIHGAHYLADMEIPLVISIDDAARHPEVVDIARQFAWPWGSKEILCREVRLGLVGHFFACGDLADKYGAIIYLEDDLVVSPVFYPYAAQMLEFYRPDDRIAGVSLYALWFNGYNRLPFVPYLDASDVFFIQVPYTQGLAFTSYQWSAFRSWQKQDENQKKNPNPFHESWSRFPPDDWFPEFARYLVATNRYFVFPRASLTTGAGDAGVHFARTSIFFQVPLQEEKTIYCPKLLDDSIAVYDSFFEILPSRLNRLLDAFQSYVYCVDLYSSRTRANIRTEFVLSSRPCRRPIFSFGKSMWPLEANIVHRTPGTEIHFCRTEDLEWGWLAELKTQESNRYYFSRGQNPGLKSWLTGKIAKILKRT